MIKLSQMTIPPPLVAGFAYLCGYVLIDMVANDQFPNSLGIAAWHPSVGLSFLLVLLYGPRMLPLLFIGPFAAELIIRGSVVLAVLEAIPVGGGYALATMLLRRPELRFDVALTSLRAVFVLMAVTIVSSASVSVAYVGLLVATGFLESVQLSSTFLAYWVGDMVGIAIVTPFCLLTLTRQRLVKFDWRIALQVAIIVFALAVAIGSAERERLQLFFLLFLPITWIAVSSGLEGVAMALMVTQIGLIAALHYIPGSVIDVLALQARMLVLAVSGLVAGALVTEARRAEQTLRENQAAIARLSRLGSMGELAIAIAHEVNQPLSAAGTYSRLVTEALETEQLSDTSIVVMARKATVQVERAADVIRRLRTLVRLGRSELSPTNIEPMLQESLDLVRLILERSDIAVTVTPDKALPAVMADRIQIQQVLFNLLRNSAEAINAAATADRRILVQATRASAQLAEIRVNDTGPGFPDEILRAAPTLFSSNKADGLGVGLSLCRSIIEAHGGAIRLESTNEGACVSFTLPFAETDLT
jgi:two-component system, LuxR family, sensor kinase FixL